MARAYCMRHASSDLPSTPAISGNDSSSKARSRMTCRWASVNESSAVSRRSARSSRMRRVNAERLRAARSSAAAEILLALDVALLPVMEVRAIADFVLRDAHQPSEQRAAVLSLEVVEVLERLEERGLQDVARLQTRAKAAPHFQPDERKQAGTEPLVQSIERRVGARERLAQHRGAGSAVHRSDTLPRVRFSPPMPSLQTGGIMRMISVVCGVAVAAAMSGGCLRKEVVETIYLAPGGQSGRWSSATSGRTKRSRRIGSGGTRLLAGGGARKAPRGAGVPRASGPSRSRRPGCAASAPIRS